MISPLPYSVSQTASQRAFRWFRIVAPVATVLLVAPELFAQEDGEAIPERVTLATQFKESGLWMIPLYICSLLMVALWVYNFISLTKAKFNPSSLSATLMEHMSACRARSAIEVASQSPTFFGRMMATALPHVDATDPETLGRAGVEDAIAEFTIRENRPHMTWINYFSILAQVAPMLGLLGTVGGMIAAFATLRQTGGADPSALAGDISTALITTACGLVIAIPSLFGYFIFKGKLTKMVAECHYDAAQMMDASIQTVNADQQLAKVPEGIQG